MLESLSGIFALLFKGSPRVVVESGLRECGKSGKGFPSPVSFEVHPPRVLTQLRSRIVEY